MFCPNCGFKNEEGITFCANCGTRIAAEEQPVYEAQPVQPEQPAPETVSYQNQQNQYTYNPQPTVGGEAPKEGNGKATAAFLCGLFGLLVNCACCVISWGAVIISIILGILAIVFAVLSKKKTGKMPGLSVAGIIFGIIGIVVALIEAFVLVSFIISADYAKEQVLKQIEEYEENGETDVANMLRDIYRKLGIDVLPKLLKK